MKVQVLVPSERRRRNERGGALPMRAMNSAIFVLTWFKVGSLVAARRIRSIRLGRLRWLVYLVIGTTVTTAALVTVGFRHVYFDPTNLPDIEPFTRFEFPTIGHVYDAHGQPLMELAREYRRIIKYEDINVFHQGGLLLPRITDMTANAMSEMNVRKPPPG